MDVYDNSQTCLFELIDGDTPVYRDAYVSCVELEPSRTLRLTAALPRGRWLLELQNGAYFEIVHSECSNRSIYENADRVLFRLSNCAIVERRLDDIVALTGKVVRVDATLKCDVEIPEWGDE